MICRVAFHDTSPEPITSERAVAFRAWIKAMPGFVAGWHATDPATGRVITFTVFETEADLAALRDRIPPGGPVGMKAANVELFPIAIAF